MRQGRLLPQIRVLVELDQVDRAILRVQENTRATHSAQQAAETAISELTQSLSQNEKALQEHQRLQRLRERQLQETETRIKRIGTFEDVKNEREFDAAQREVVQLKSLRDTLETEILLGFDRTEQLTQDLTRLQAKIAQNRRKQSEKTVEWTESLQRDASEIEELRRLHAIPLTQLEAPLRHTYERLLERYKGRAMVTVIDGRCPPCHLTVPAQHVIDILMGDAIHECQQCHRLLLPREFESSSGVQPSE